MEKIFNEYPFGGIVGQESLKKALILNLIDDSIGGVLIDGEKGVSKSTIVRSLEGICSKRIINLPLNVTEDALSGAMNIEETLKHGNIVKDESILEKAKHNILYVDEVNLLEDRIIDILISSIDGEAKRDNIILIGTMNKEEGELRKEFLDRFPMYVEVKGSKDIAVRKEIMIRRLEFEKDKKLFLEKYINKDSEIKIKINKAKEFLHKVKVNDESLGLIAKICIDYGVEGHRADIYMKKIAMAICAFEFKEIVLEEHILEAAKYVLPHRLTKIPEEQDEKEKDSSEDEDLEEDTEENEEETQEEAEEDKEQQGKEEMDSERNQENGDYDNTKKEDYSNEQDYDGESNEKSSDEFQVFSVGSEVELKEFLLDKDNKRKANSGKRIDANSNDNKGRFVKTSSKVINNDIALVETIRYAAPYQKNREKNGLAIRIYKDDLRGKVRRKKSSSFIVFVVDSSGSLGVNKRMVEVKGAILSILKDAYVKRDYVSLVIARGLESEVILPKTNSVERGYRLLKEVKTGGKTPLNSGIVKGLEIIKRECRLDDSIRPILVVISDGKGNVSLNKSLKPKEELMMLGNEIRKDINIKTIVLDVEKPGMMSFGLAKKFSESAMGEYIHIENLKQDDILGSINEVRKEQ